MTGIQDGPTGSTTYLLSLGYDSNGDVSQYDDSAAGNWAYTYDAFNRLASSTCTLNCPGSGNSEAYTYSYDQFGNRWKQHVTAGTGYEADYAFDTNNPATSHNRNTTSGFAYDVAGNLTSNGSCTPCWSYDYSNHVLSDNGGAAFAYDGLGNRVQRTYSGATQDFILDNGGNPISEYQGSVPSRFTGGVFTYANGVTYFPRPDHLGTPRVTTDYTGAVQRTETNLPFGDGFSETASPFVDFTGFAAGVWNAEDNSDHFGAREYAKSQGRWLTPDPAGLAAVNPSDPQTWNRYAYVGNNPTSFTDPSGLVSMPNVGTYASMGGGGFVGGCTQDGLDSNCLTNLTLVGAGAAGNCPQCTPGNPGGVEQLGTFAPIYGWTYQPGSSQVNTSVSTTIIYDGSTIGGGTSPVSTSTIEAPGTYSYGVIGYDTSDFGGDGDLMAQNLPQGPQRPPAPGQQRPLPLPIPNTPPGKACSKYSPGMYRTVCNVTPNSPTNNCVRGNLLNLYDPISGQYPGGAQSAHCDSFATCGMSPWNPFQKIWQCNKF